MIDIDRDCLIKQYNESKSQIESMKNSLIDTLKINLEEIEYIDNIYGRIKTKKSFIEKVLKNPHKYQNPFKDVEDIIGIRILVLFKDTSQIVSDKIRNDIFPCLEYEYKHEKDEKSLPNEKAFGYEGYQSIHSIPESLLIDKGNENIPNVFELQVRTLFQHAWAEPEHEINYKRKIKFNEKSEFEYKRSFAWIAASSWGADKILDELYKVYKNNHDE